MKELLASESPDLRLEAVQTLQQTSAAWAAELLRGVATDDENSGELGAEAIVGLAAHPDEKTRDLLRELMIFRQVGAAVRTEAIRSLRGVAAGDADVRDALLEEGRKLQFVALVTPEVREKANQLALAVDGTLGAAAAARTDENAAARLGIAAAAEELKPLVGRFRSLAAVVRDSPGTLRVDHTVHARGGNVGPDLSVIARTVDRKKLAESILEPSKEISPQFTGWTFVMKSGQVHTGLTVGEGPGDVIHVGTPDGAVVTLKREEIEERLPQTVSIMPDKLEERLTPGEFRDLLAFLETLK